MPKETIKDLRAERDTLATEARNNLDKNTADFDGPRQDEIYASIGKIDDRIKAMRTQLDLDARLASEGEDADTPAAAKNKVEVQNVGDEVRNIVFNAYLRGGDKAVDRLPENVLTDYHKQVQNAQDGGTTSGGGALLPTTFAGVLLEAMKSHGGMRSVANVQKMTSGETIQWPTVDETAEEGEWMIHDTDSADGDITFGTTNIGAHMASSRVVAVPIPLLMDAGIGDVAGMINKLLAMRLSRTTNKGYTIGDGNGKPSGVVGGSSVGWTTLAGFVDSFGWDDLTELEHSVDFAYRENATWMFNDSVLKAAKMIKDADNRPIWVPGVSGSAPAEINGYKYTVNQDLAELAAGSKSTLFGDFSKYLIRDVMDVTLFRFDDSAYKKRGQVGFMAMMRTDGKVIAADDKAIRVMQQAAA